MMNDQGFAILPVTTDATDATDANVTNTGGIFLLYL
jgi:hypothetical protein